MLIAEQVSIKCPVDAVVAGFTRGGVDWWGPFLSLAWNEGETALRRRTGVIAAESQAARHKLRLGAPVAGTDGSASFPLTWTVAGTGVLFRRLKGRLLIQPFEGCTALGLLGRVVTDGDLDGYGTASRPAEVVARSLLGHLRTAMEGAQRRSDAAAS